MKNYKVLEAITFAPGAQLGLTDAQAKDREGLIEKVGKKGNVYDIVKPVSFKIGEQIGVVDDIPKALNAKLKDTAAVEGDVDEDKELTRDEKMTFLRGQHLVFKGNISRIDLDALYEANKDGITTEQQKVYLTSKAIEFADDITAEALKTLFDETVAANNQ